MLLLTNRLKNKYKTLEILDCWERGDPVSILQVGNDTNHYEACSHEYATICAIGVDHITNVYNCTPYGAMKSWNKTLTTNYGLMLIFNTLVQNMFTNPTKVRYEDIFVKH